MWLCSYKVVMFSMKNILCVFHYCGLLGHVSLSPTHTPKINIIPISLTHTCIHTHLGFLVNVEVTPHSLSESDRSLYDLLSESSLTAKHRADREYKLTGFCTKSPPEWPSLKADIFYQLLFFLFHFMYLAFRGIRKNLPK